MIKTIIKKTKDYSYFKIYDSKNQYKTQDFKIKEEKKIEDRRYFLSKEEFDF